MNNPEQYLLNGGILGCAAPVYAGAQVDRAIEHPTAAAFEREVRKTPPGGGAKGSKPERYDLIPFNMEFLGGESGTPYQQLADCASAFWYRRSWTAHLSMLGALSVIEGLLGGSIAARKHLAHVYGFGAIKYGDNNWQKGYPWSWAYAALWRHLEAWHRGEMIDPEGNFPHLAAVWFHFAALIKFQGEGLGTDDRPEVNP